MTEPSLSQHGIPPPVSRPHPCRDHGRSSCEHPDADYTEPMDFRRRLIETLRAVQPVLDVPGVMVVGSEVPNLLEPNAASTLVVSQDVDIGVPVAQHAAVKHALDGIERLRPAPDEPSVWVPTEPDLIEVNFVGMDPAIHDIAETYVLEDSSLPLLVFGPLSFIEPAPPVEVADVRLTLPRPAGLLLEKLVTERTGEKGDRDLLVVLGLLLVASDADIEEAARIFSCITPELQQAARNNLSLLSLLEPRTGMPDPRLHRRKTSALLARLEAAMRKTP